MTSEVYDVVVVGAGAMGSAAAWALARAGREVLVLEQHALGHDRGGSHGRSRLFRLDYSSADNLAAAGRAQRLWERLEADSGETLLTRVGGVEHGLGADRVASAQRWCAEAGVPVEVLSADEAGERWPQLGFEDTVVFQPGAGRLDADRALAVLRRSATARGAEFRAGCRVVGLAVVERADAPGGALVEVRTSDTTLRARQVVAAVGSWAPGLLGDLVPLPPITVTQEQPRVFRPHQDGSNWPVFVHWRSETGRFGAAAGYGCFEPGAGVKVGLHRSGPTVDPDRRPPPDVELDAVLIDYVRRWYPGLAVDASTPISCLYDNSHDETFVVDRVGPLTVATGFSGEGFKFVPVIGELLRDLVTGEAAAPARFTLGPHRGAATG